MTLALYQTNIGDIILFCQFTKEQSTGKYAILICDSKGPSIIINIFHKSTKYTLGGGGFSSHFFYTITHSGPEQKNTEICLKWSDFNLQIMYTFEFDMILTYICTMEINVDHDHALRQMSLFRIKQLRTQFYRFQIVSIHLQLKKLI